MPSVDMEVENLTTSYGSFKVSGVSFTLHERDILGLVGRSGSGKSTLLKTLIGLKGKQSGKVTVLKDGKPVPIGKLLGYSPQENALYPFLTLEENLVTFASLYNLPKRLINQRMESLLARLDLQNCRRKKVVDLSGGMMKRADIATALIHNPDVIILDEPFTGLDISLQGFIWDFLVELSEDDRIIIISSHMLNDIQKHCNQFGLIEGGQYYDTQQLVQTIKKNGGDSLEGFLHRLFSWDMSRER